MKVIKRVSKVFFHYEDGRFPLHLASQISKDIQNMYGFVKFIDNRDEKGEKAKKSINFRFGILKKDERVIEIFELAISKSTVAISTSEDSQMGESILNEILSLIEKSSEFAEKTPEKCEYESEMIVQLNFNMASLIAPQFTRDIEAISKEHYPKTNKIEIHPFELKVKINSFPTEISSPEEYSRLRRQDDLTITVASYEDYKQKKYMISAELNSELLTRIISQLELDLDYLNNQ